jgi:hypothetical protein
MISTSLEKRRFSNPTGLVSVTMRMSCGLAVDYTLVHAEAERERERGSLAAIDRQTEHALMLADGAQVAYQAGYLAWAGMLHAAAERSHNEILSAIGDLTTLDADHVEPAVIRLERSLYRLWPLWRGPSESGATEGPYKM